MSSINLSNPQVLSNWIKSQIAEGNGIFLTKKDVTIFKSNASGQEFIVPEGAIPSKAEEVKQEVVQETPAVAQEVVASPVVALDPLTCPECGKTFKGKLGLQSHLRTHNK